MSEQDPTPPTPRSPEAHELTTTALAEETVNMTIGKESPLTDIATSPPPFDLNLNHSDFNSEDSKSEEEHTGVKYGFGGIRRRKDSYESSELSDLDEDQSEAETDKMDFLDEEDGDKDVSQGEDEVSDLRTLSKLTELARLKDVDSSDDSDGNKELDGEIKEEEQEQEEVVEEETDRKRELEDEQEEPVNKKLKVEEIEQATDEVEEAEVKEQPEDTEDIEEPAEEESVDPVVTYDDSNAEAGDEANDDEDDEGSTKSELPDKVEPQDAAESVQEEDQIDLNEQRKLAIEELISIESRFAELRDKLYQDKLNLLERELTLCLEGSHPELSKVYYKINGFYQDSLKLANSNLAYKLKCIDKETIATRTSIHQDFLKNLMDTKNQMITDTTSLWYKINKERNQLDQLVPAFNFSAIPDVSQSTSEYIENPVLPPHNGYHEDLPISKKLVKQNTLIELVHQRNSINEQLGVLNGLIQFHGFPVSVNSTLSQQQEENPEELLLKRASDNEINDDLKAMGISI
ncbi:Transcriptional regulatory protein DEP1 [Spathaspora sp. JA1]|nr:Transcriptional regulatory protein DEP1 [Spathaspora sp. JA1]